MCLLKNHINSVLILVFEKHMKIKTVLLDCQKEQKELFANAYSKNVSLGNQGKITSNNINCRISYLNISINERGVIEDYLSGEIIIIAIKANFLKVQPLKLKKFLDV